MDRRRPGRPKLSPEEKAKSTALAKRARKMKELVPIIRQAEAIGYRLTGNKDINFNVPEAFPFIGRLKLLDIVFKQLYEISVKK